MNCEMGIAGWFLSGEILREKTLTLLEFPAVCAGYGVTTVELCSRFFENQDAKYLNELRTELTTQNLTVHSMAVDMGNIAGADPAVRRTDLEALKQWFYVASAIGSAAIRINTGHADDDGAMDRVIDGYQELVRVAADTGVKLLIENHGGVSSTSENLQRILDALDSENFATCPDTGNFGGNDWESGMQVLAPRAFSCHVKVFDYSDDGSQSRTDRDGNEHTYDLKKSLQILSDAGYDGPLCVEAGASKDVREGIGETIAYVSRMAEGI
jgi:sugar phosphate isomerase/epimerase